eukprot:5108437-Pleurochrysis_carterae.AAC.1
MTSDCRLAAARSHTSSGHRPIGWLMRFVLSQLLCATVNIRNDCQWQDKHILGVAVDILTRMWLHTNLIILPMVSAWHENSLGVVGVASAVCRLLSLRLARRD